jgi:hypothetical protein
MQIIDKTPNTIKAFAITLPILTVVSALIIFNLDAEIFAFDSLVRRVTFGLQRQMKLHYRRGWKDRALALYQDHLITEPPARKAAKQSSNWVYILFLIETIITGLPVSEVHAALNFYGLLNLRNEIDEDDDSSEKSDDENKFRKTMRKEVRRRVKRAAQQANKEEQRRREYEKGALRALTKRFLRRGSRIARQLLRILFSSFRVLFIPVWIFLLALQYILVVTYLVLTYHSSPRAEPSSRGQKIPSPQENISPFIEAWRLLGLQFITFPKRDNNKEKYTPENPRTRQPRSKAQKGKEKENPDQENQPTTTFRELMPTAPRLRSIYPGRQFIESDGEGRNVELSTFQGYSAPRSDTVKKMSRAVNYASHAGGFIPGDFLRAEMDPDTEPVPVPETAPVLAPEPVLDSEPEPTSR